MMTRRSIMAAAAGAALASAAATAGAQPRPSTRAMEVLKPGNEQIAMMIYPGIIPRKWWGPTKSRAVMPG